MTGTVPSSGRGRTAAAMEQKEQTVEEHATLEQQPLGRFDHITSLNYRVPTDRPSMLLLMTLGFQEPSAALIPVCTGVDCRGTHHC